MAEMTELEFLVQAATAERASLDAKAAWLADPGNEELRAAFVAAKHANRELKAFWRGVREALRPEPADGDGVATPDTHGMGTSIGSGSEEG